MSVEAQDSLACVAADSVSVCVGLYPRDVSAVCDSAVILPEPLRPGDRIAILSPAGASRPVNVYKAVAALRSRGYDPYVTFNSMGRYGTYSGTESQRFDDIKTALLDRDTKAIICARGGYGAVQLLDSLDCLPLRDNAKWLVGFSDISALHALLHKHGIVSVHGPMTKHIGSDDGGAVTDCDALFGILGGDAVEYVLEPHGFNRMGSVTATLTGGNMAVLTALIGTPFNMIRPGTVLFIEDISEPVYKVERMLYQLKLCGILPKLAGLIVGEFTDCPSDDSHPSMYGMIHRMVAPYDYPVVFGFPAGHGQRNIPLMESMPVQLTVGSDRVVIRQ